MIANIILALLSSFATPSDMQPPADALYADVPFLPEDIAPSFDEQKAPEVEENSFLLPPSDKVSGPELSPSSLDRAGPLTLSAHLRGVEAALGECERMREGMEEAILTAPLDQGAVHPDWFSNYSGCIRQRNDELKALGKTLRTRQQALLDTSEGEDALNAADAIARLLTYHTKLRRAVREEFTAQRTLVELYNEKNR